MIPGHEFLGHVVELGENVAARVDVKIGNRLIFEQIVPCWQFRFCKRGEYWMCEEARCLWISEQCEWRFR